MAKKLTQIECTIDNEIGAVVIKLPLGNPQPSASGKTIVIASTRGNLRTTTMVQGKPLTIGCNCYIAKD